MRLVFNAKIKLIVAIYLSSIATVHASEPVEMEFPHADSTQNSINQIMQDTALWLDQLAQNEALENDERKASAFGYLQLSWRPYRGDLNDLDAKFKVHFNLPKWDDRLALVIDNDSEDDLMLDYESDPAGNNQYDELNIALQYFRTHSSGQRVKFRVGKKRNELYARAETNFQWQFENYKIDLLPRVDYYYKSGWGPGIKSAFTYYFSKDKISLSASLQKLEVESKIRVKAGLYHIKTLRQDHFFVSGLEYNQDNKERHNHNDHYLASVRYRKAFYKNWLHFEIEPYLLFRQELNYKDEFGVNFSLIGYYGNTTKL